MINVHSGCIMIINIFLQIIAVGNLRVIVARQPPAGLEPAIFGLEGRRLIQLGQGGFYLVVIYF